MPALTDELSAAGFSQSEINTYMKEERVTLRTAGFNDVEIDLHFNGKPKYDPAPIDVEVAKKPSPEAEDQEPTFMELVQGGWEQSVTGLAMREKLPETEVPEDLGYPERLVPLAATLAGDLPAIVTGAGVGFLGGGPVGAGAGGFGLPAGLRKVMMDKYEKGEVTSPREFWARLTGAVEETVKGQITGAATVVAGQAGRAVATSLSLPASTLGIPAEVATMVTVGSGLEGVLPAPEDFLDAAILIGGIHASVKVAGKMRSAYSKYGKVPEEVLNDLERNPAKKEPFLNDEAPIEDVYPELEVAPSLRVGATEAPAAPAKPPSGFASSTEFAGTPSDIGFDLPEVVALAKALSGGEAPAVKQTLRSKKALGTFNPKTGKMEVRADLFKDPAQASKTIAHEIGHLVDWLPDQTMARGNVLGRVASLKRHMGRYIAGEPGGPGPLSEIDRARLKKTAAQRKRESFEIEVDQEIRETMPVTPDQVLKIFNDVTGGTGSPELVDYIKRASSAEKKSIIKEAFAGRVPEEVAQFASETVTTVKTKKSINRELTKGELKAEYQRLVENEIRLRKLLSSEEITAELKDLTLKWRGLKDADLTPAFRKYLYSSAELYADAVSALVTSPKTLMETAPEFWRGFHAYLDRKPEMRDNFKKIQEEMKAGQSDAAFSKQLKEGFRKGEEARAERVKKDVEKAFTKDAWGTSYVDQFYSIFRRVKSVGEKDLDPSKNPRLAIEEMQHGANSAEGYLIDLNTDVIKLLEKNGVSYEDFGEYLFNRRVVFERNKMANPGGQTPERAAKRLAEMDKQLGPELRKAVEEYNKIRKEWFIDNAVEAEMFPPELINIMKDNEAYATFDVVKFLENQYGGEGAATIHKQFGTLADIDNPFTATVLKDLSLMRSVDRNNAIKTTAEFLQEHMPNEVSEPRRAWTGKRMEFLEPTDPNQGLIRYLDKGEMKAVVTDKFIADAFKKNPVETMITARILRATATPFKLVFTQLNPGFWLTNMVRDYRRSVRNLEGMNVPGASIFNFLPEYLDAFKPAFRSSLKGIRDDQVKQMMKEKQLISIGDFRGEALEDVALDRMLKKFHINGEYNKKVGGPVRTLFQWYSAIGQGLERVPKIAGDKYLRKNFPEMDAKTRAHIIRGQVGSPDFLRKGTAHPITNNLFIFSNAIKEGFRADIEVMKDRPAEFAWKTAQQTVMPKMIMYAAATGMMGVGVKEIMDRVSDYDKANYDVIPLAVTPSGKAVYLRIPHDEVSRMVGGLFWKTLNSEKEFKASDMFSYMAGQVPSMHPLGTLAGQIMVYASGENPYDFFKQRNVLSDQTHLAGGPRAHKEFAKWMSNQLGGGIVHRFKSENEAEIKSELEEILGYPISSNILGRFLKVSDLGIREGIKGDIKKLRSLAANDAIIASEAATKLIADNTYELTQEEMESVALTAKSFPRKIKRALMSRYGDVYIEELFAARTPQERLVVLNRMQKDSFSKHIRTTDK